MLLFVRSAQQEKNKSRTTAWFENRWKRKQNFQFPDDATGTTSELIIFSSKNFRRGFGDHFARRLQVVKFHRDGGGFVFEWCKNNFIAESSRSWSWSLSIWQSLMLLYFKIISIVQNSIFVFSLTFFIPAFLKLSAYLLSSTHSSTCCRTSCNRTPTTCPSAEIDTFASLFFALVGNTVRTYSSEGKCRCSNIYFTCSDRNDVVSIVRLGRVKDRRLAF